jgi:hypothetical protein
LTPSATQTSTKKTLAKLRQHPQSSLSSAVAHAMLIVALQQSKFALDFPDFSLLRNS